MTLEAGLVPAFCFVGRALQVGPPFAVYFLPEVRTMMRFARTVLMLLLMTGWAAAQCGGHAMGSDEKGKKDSATAGHQAMSCCCCKNMSKDAAKTGAAKAGDKDAAKSEAKSEGGMMAGGMACCAKKIGRAHV